MVQLNHLGINPNEILQPPLRYYYNNFEREITKNSIPQIPNIL